jgi:hypothetical protein
MNNLDGKAARRRRDLRSAALAVGLLALCGGAWLFLSSDAGGRRDKVLASIPAFPEKGQDDKPRRAMAPNVPARPQPRPKPMPLPASAAEPQRRADPITSFVLAPAPSVALVHVNAILNSPLFARFKECMPARWTEATQQMQKLGIDVERDVDRMAMAGDGMAMSGFFEGKPIAQNIAARWPGAQQRDYRGAQVWSSSNGGSVAQVGNLLLFGSGQGSSIERLVDRAIDPPPAGADPDDIYGDLFLRSDLGALRANTASSGNDAMQAILEGLNGVTVRANVWDSVALSLEGKPRTGQSVADLARMARGAIALAKEQVDPSDVELGTLAELAKVQHGKDQLNIDLALPAADLFDKLHFPCPGKEGR